MGLEDNIKKYLESKDVQINKVDVNDNILGLSVNFDYYGEELSSNDIDDFEDKFNLKKVSSKVNVLPYKNYTGESYVDILHCTNSFGVLT